MESNKKNVFKKCLFLAFLIIIITIVISISIKYSVVGEKTLPYSLKKILIVSTVDTSNNEDEANLWNINLSENNNVFIYIEKSNETTTDTIKEISLENFTITNSPKIGNVFLYRPTGDLKNLYEHSTQNYLNDKITYTGARVDTLNVLEIGNEGGMMGFRISLNDIGNYVSNNYDEELVYDGTLLDKAGITAEQISFSMSFDIKISLNSGVEFQGTILLDLPAGDIINEKEPYIEITDFSNVIFKRL
jgi:hypothetical protein